MIQFFWIRIQAFRTRYRRARRALAEAEWQHDPLAHPVLRTMSMEELADLPMDRTANARMAEPARHFAPATAGAELPTPPPSFRPESRLTGVSKAVRKVRPVPPTPHGSLPPRYAPDQAR